ncbi:major facilitator superfamily domain-containing protein [Radiomyces spectabilis]|uniref:major facilitator superfamily domain-containing protein n=1 Tax=Radiomyces spectabilis TaxID=64574 RepID=UPI00221FC50D|nr:major facilitator superfamily domain-containing protein [Radiomyces spectabilis]KAI8381196.1 major facilitator superfamily domain-containing protein [Radiomyces spectabilis]
MYTICKLLYVTVFALLSAAPPYLPLYYDAVLGFSSDQIGFVLAIAPFVQSVACPLWTFLVDKRPHLHGSVMALTSFLGGISLLGIMGLGHSIRTTSVVLNDTTVVICTSALAFAFAFFTLPNTSLVDSAVMKILGPDKLLYGEQRLWGSLSTGLTILLVGQLISYTGNLDALFWVFGGSTLAFVVCAAVANVNSNDIVLPLEDLETEYAQQPLMSPSNQSMEKYGHRAPANYLSTTHAASSLRPHEQFKGHDPLIFKAASIVSAHTVREEAEEALDVVGVDLGLAISRISSVDQSLMLAPDAEVPPADVFKSPRVLCFLTTTLIFGVVLSMIVNFLFLFLSREMHTPASWIGWTGPMSGVTELLCFCFSKQMTEKFGVTKMVVIAHVATLIRCLAYTVLVPDSLITNIIALLLQMLHGIGFGIFWATAVSEIDSFFPPEQRAVAQGILGALHAGLGTGLGAFIGGYLLEYCGSVWLFRVAALLTLISTVIFCVGRLKRYNF